MAKVKTKITTKVKKNKPTEEKEKIEKKEATETKKKVRGRSKKYCYAKAKIDLGKFYPLKKAIELVKETSLSKFTGKVEVHINTLEIGNYGEITFPYLATTQKKIVILNDTFLDEIKNGQINFDILIATPATMPKLLPLAKILGPKGLMPNPKNGTLTDKPEEAVKKLATAKTPIKTEKKAPIIHIIVGKVSQPTEELAANISELIKVVKPSKIKKLVLCATMGPAIKVEINQ